MKTPEQLEAGLAEILASPRDEGVLQMIVRRPDVDEREVLDEARLDVEEGLVGDDWIRRQSRPEPDPRTQITMVNSRVMAVVAERREDWPQAGDQLFVEMDLSADNFPPGTRLALGEATLEVTEVPHTGCRKFRDRFGHDALRFISTQQGLAMRMRGMYARVVTPGTVRVGDIARKL